MKRMMRFRFSIPRLFVFSVLLLVAFAHAAPAHAAGEMTTCGSAGCTTSSWGKFTVK